MKYFATFLSILGLNVALSVATDVERYSNLVTALKYNDECSWDNEVLRQKFVRETLNMDSNSSNSSFIEDTVEFEYDVIVNKRRLCNILEQFTCDEESERCVCGDSSKKVLYPGLNVSSEYEVVRDDDGSFRCQWKEGSYCSTKDFLIGPESRSRSYAECVDGTSCMSTLNGTACNLEAMILYAIKTRATVTTESLVKALFEGKICSCQPDADENSISEEDEKSRFKRSVVSNEDREWAKALIAPALKYL